MPPASGSSSRYGSLESGSTPVLDRTYPLADTAQGLRHVEGGHARGKVVITVA